MEIDCSYFFRLQLCDWTNIKRGLRQRCVLSPDLFSLYTELIMKKVSNEGTFRSNRQFLSDIRHADDTVLMSYEEQDLEMLNSFKAES